MGTFVYFFVWLKVFLDSLIHIGELVLLIRMGYLVADNLIEILDGWIECLLWVKALIHFNFIVRVDFSRAEVHLLDEFCSCFSLDIG